MSRKKVKNKRDKTILKYIVMITPEHKTKTLSEYLLKCKMQYMTAINEWF